MKPLIGLAPLFICLSSVADDAHWNQFRGPRGDGASRETELPLRWKPGGPSQVWKTEIHGKGWSSPVVWGDQIWLTTAPVDGKRLHAMCLDRATGKIVRDVEVFRVQKPQFCHPTNSYASCTPLIEDGRIYVHFGRYGTACLDTETGKVLWERRDLLCDHFRGPASSPVVHGNALFLNFDGVDVQFVVALDKRTGKLLWKKDRGIDYGTDNGDRKKAYGTPTLVTHQGLTQLVSPAAVETIAYAPLTGEVLWNVRHGGMNAAARPLFANGLIYISAGSGNTQLVAVRPNGRGNVTDSHVVWHTGKSVPKRSSQVLSDGLLFMVSDQGVVSCLDAVSGELVWQERLPGDYWASPLLANGHIYCFSKSGQVSVLRAGRRFQRVSQTTYDAGFNASPAVAGKSLILRTFKHVYCVGR